MKTKMWDLWSVGPMDGTGHRPVNPTLGEPEPTPLAPPGLSSLKNDSLDKGKLDRSCRESSDLHL